MNTYEASVELGVSIERILGYINRGMLNSRLQNPNMRGGSGNRRIISQEDIDEFRSKYTRHKSGMGNISYITKETPELDSDSHTHDSASDEKLTSHENINMSDYKIDPTCGDIQNKSDTLDIEMPELHPDAETYHNKRSELLSANTKITDFLKITIVDELVFKSFIKRILDRSNTITELSEMLKHMSDICENILQANHPEMSLRTNDIIQLLVKLNEIEPKYKELVTQLLDS